MKKKPEFVCVNCGYVGPAKKKVPGSFAIELILWLIFLLPGLIYSTWRMASKKQVCSKCDSDQIIPTDSPRGQQMLAERGV